MAARKKLPRLFGRLLPSLSSPDLSGQALVPGSVANFTKTAHSQLPFSKEKLTLIPMPQLSPTMTSGKIRKWLKQPGDEIATYDVVMEVDTESLSEDGYKVGNFAGTVTMLVEAQEDGFVSKILVPEGKEVDVHTPVATMCEFEEDLKALDGAQEEVDELLAEPSKVRGMTWQSYLKDGKEGRKGCN